MRLYYPDSYYDSETKTGQFYVRIEDGQGNSRVTKPTFDKLSDVWKYAKKLCSAYAKRHNLNWVCTKHPKGNQQTVYMIKEKTAITS